MKVDKLIRNSKRVLKAWRYDNKANVIVAAEPCRIMFPKHYVDGGKLGLMENNILVVAIFAIVVEDKYFAVSNAAAQMPLSPDSVNTVTIDDAEYYELSWDKDSIICPNTKLVKNKDIAYEINSEFVKKGKTPWYMNALDLISLTNTFEEYAGVNLGVSETELGIQTAARMRQPENRTRFIREKFKTQDDLENMPSAIIPLRSIGGGASNTNARIIGSYHNEGIVSSLVNTTEKVEAIEEFLRS